MQTSDKSARQLFAEIKANPTRKRFGFGRTPALINVDLQKAYDSVDRRKLMEVLRKRCKGEIDK